MEQRGYKGDTGRGMPEVAIIENLIAPLLLIATSAAVATVQKQKHMETI